MRRDWRKVLALGILFLADAACYAAPRDGTADPRAPESSAVRYTIDLRWGQNGAPVVAAPSGDGSSGVRLELSTGRVLGAIEWPGGSFDGAPLPVGWGPVEGGGWRLGDGPQGHARARIESPVDARLIVHHGDQTVTIPVAAVLERPQNTPSTSTLAVAVERLAWDAIRLDLEGDAADRIVSPGDELPVSIGFNILWPEATDVSVRYSAILRPARSDEVLSQQDLQTVLAANGPGSKLPTLAMKAPETEGAYILEVQANWEPVFHEGSRFGRLIRRRRPSGATSAVRRISLFVMAPEAAAPKTPKKGGADHEKKRGEVEVDAVDLSRSRIHRPLARGRSPMAEPGRSAWGVPPEALIEPSGRDRLRGWFHRSGPDANRLDPADENGLAWAAVGLKAEHPGRPHRLTIAIKRGEPALLGVGLIDAGNGANRARPRVLLDACATGPLALEKGTPPTFSWLVWPGTAENVLVVVNRSPDAAVSLGAIKLTEIDELPAATTKRKGDTPATRALGIYLDGPNALDRFGSNGGPEDLWLVSRNLIAYLSCCGASAVVVPESLSDRLDPGTLEGQGIEDAARPDRLEVLRRMLKRRGYAMWLEVSFAGRGALPGLPPPDSEEAVRRGLVRVDSHGIASEPCYHALHPDVRRAMRRRVVEALAHSGASPGSQADGLAGLLIRLGPGPTLLGTPDTGIDDTTFDRFVRETFSPETAREIPGLGTGDEGRFAARLKYLAGTGRMPWLTWRTRSLTALYKDLTAAVHEAAPEVELAVVTPGLDGGPAGAEARRVDLAGLTPGLAWRNVGLDLSTWPVSPESPAVFRGASLSSDDLAHDLAISPDLDAIVASRQRRGLLLTVDGLDSTERPSAVGAPSTPRDSPSAWLSALSLGDVVTADEPLAHALASLDARWVFLSASASAGHEERLRRFAGVLRALPDGPPGTSSEPRTMPFGTLVRTINDADQTYLSIANDSPFPIRLACLLDAPQSAGFEDLGRGFRLSPVAGESGGRNLVLDLRPFGVSAIRVKSDGVRVLSTNEYPSEAVLAGMRARSHELSLRLSRLNQGLAEVATEPANPGFEPGLDPMKGLHPSSSAGSPVTDPGVTTAGGVGPSRPATSSWPSGWRLEPGQSAAVTPGTGEDPAKAKEARPSPANIAIDTESPHQGRGSLRLSAPSAPASVVSESFMPTMQSSLTIRAYFRASPPDATARIWIEGEAGGEPYIRRSDLTIPGTWEARAVRASDLPPGGLDSARLRFELLTPGVLWLDDLRISGDGAGKSVRRNAQRTMLAALQAYRERRYADFARLAGSHWVKQSAGLTARLARSDPESSRSGTPGTEPSDASASALPSDRKLR